MQNTHNSKSTKICMRQVPDVVKPTLTPCDGGVFPTGGLAAWDGIGWSAGGGGIPGVVTSLYVNGTFLYVGGRFNDDGPRRGNIAMLDSQGIWHPLCDEGSDHQACGVSGGEIYAMVAVGRMLYVAGSFEVLELYSRQLSC
jgi:hypothetical protein